MLKARIVFYVVRKFKIQKTATASALSEPFKRLNYF